MRVCAEWKLHCRASSVRFARFRLFSAYSLFLGEPEVKTHCV